MTGINCRTNKKFLNRTRERQNVGNLPRSGGEERRRLAMTESWSEVSSPMTSRPLRTTARFNARTWWGVSSRTFCRRLF